LTIAQVIEQVNSGYFIHKSLRKHPQDFRKGLNHFNAEGRGYDAMINHNFKRVRNDALEMINKALISKQRGVFTFFLREMGAALISGKSVMSVSFPVTVFENRSLLERVANTMLFGP